MSHQPPDLFRVIAASVPALVSYIGADLRYRWANGKYEHWLHQRPDEIAGRHVREVLGEDAWLAVRPRMERALAGEEVTYEDELPYRGGGPRWVRVSYTPDRDEAGAVRGFVVLVNEIAGQKRAEQRVAALTEDLQARVGELQGLLELLPLGVFLGRDPDCKEIATNRTGAAMLGLPEGANASMSGDGAAALPFRVLRDGAEVAPEDLPMQRAARSDLRVDGEELQVVREDGATVGLWWFASPLHDRDGRVRGALAAAVDVTDRNRQEAALRESEARYRALFELASVGAGQTDAITGRFLTVNRRLCEITGYSEAELLERSLYDITHPDDRERDRARVAAALERTEAERGWESEKRYVRPDGSIVWVLVTGRVLSHPSGRLRTVAHVVDITERKRTQEALHEAQERFRVAQEISLDGFTILRAIRDEAGTITDFVWDYANHAACKMLQRPPHGLQGQRLLEVLPGNRKSLFRHYVAVVETGVPHDYELRYEADGICGWFRNMAVKLGDGVAVSFSDITDRKRLEEELRDRVEELDREHRRKDEFLAMLAHELRNPLAPIRNAAALLQQVAPQAPDQRRISGILERQVAQLARLVDDLLDVSRINRGTIELRRQPCPLAAIVEVALETTRPLLEERGHHLDVSLPGSPLWVDGDATRLAQAVANLLNNAAKYTDPGGHLALLARRDGDEAVLRVRDDGIGIGAESLPHVFDMFTRADANSDRSRDGLGIGLTLVRRLVELHGGRVEAHSDGPGRGAEFSVRLPLCAPPDEDRPEVDCKGARTAALRILIADDNVDAAESLGALLRVLGQEVEVVFDGAAALAATEQRLFDLAFLDLGMPGLSGYEVAEALRARADAASTLRVALTGWGEAEARRRSREAGFHAHLVKPPELAQLQEVLARAGAREAAERPGASR